ncbi:MAG TPA: hypothetical protein VK509_04490 [Polyangiales bacterium]|nr:hypothetical protein [Polyangiales bacterium]
MSRIALVLVMGGLLLGASECGDDEADGDDGTPTEGGGVSGSGAGGDDTAGVKCGARTCGAGLVCCNASCGVCTAPGMFCTQQGCDDGGGGPGGAGDPGGGGGAGDRPAPSGPGCGGIAARECPGAGSCKDDPNDSCNPRSGGADCGGVCECRAVARCRAGQKWDASPEVCSCVGGDDPAAGSGGSAEAGAGGAAGGGAGTSGGEACGSMTCGDGETCCNPSCGICTKPGEGCTKQLCEPTDPPVKDPQRCGGFGGFPCPGLGDCADDPSDDCDPKNGGADCGGICKCTAGPTVLCQAGMPFNPDPHVCSCAPPPGSGGQPCGKNTCAEDQTCCNASCGICAPKGGACIQIACL